VAKNYGKAVSPTLRKIKRGVFLPYAVPKTPASLIQNAKTYSRCFACLVSVSKTPHLILPLPTFRHNPTTTHTWRDIDREN
jgi:hypothetical protein